jgi:hypothetical protein
MTKINRGLKLIPNEIFLLAVLDADVFFKFKGTPSFNFNKTGVSV